MNEEVKPKKFKSKTLSTLRGLKAGKFGLYAGAFVCPIVPASVVTIINWEEWFVKTNKTLPFGFASLLLTVIIAIVGILKSDKIFKKADVALYCIAGFFACIGITNLFLSSLFAQMGYMWLYTCSGILGAGVCVTVENKVIEPNIEFYKGLVENNQLDRKSKRKAERVKRAEEEAKKEAEYLEEKRRRATTE